MHRQARRLHQEGYRVVIVGDRTHSEITSLTEDPQFQGLVVAGPDELDGVKDRRALRAHRPDDADAREPPGGRRPHPAPGRSSCASSTPSATRPRRARPRRASWPPASTSWSSSAGATARTPAASPRSAARPAPAPSGSRPRTSSRRSCVGDAARVGLTAGASTPEWIITDVIRRLESLPAGGRAPGRTSPVGEVFHPTGGSTQHVRRNATTPRRSRRRSRRGR